MSSSPRISVLMSVYNGEKHLEEAIRSVLDQTFHDFEFIIINDGSKDSTARIIERYRRHDRRIQAYDQSNQGLVAALNRGLGLARGEYVARMDADDVCLPERLAQQVEFLDAHPEVGICGTWLETIGELHGEARRYPTDDTEIRCWLLFESALGHPSVMIRRAMLAQPSLSYDTACLHAEDYDLWVRAARHTVLANIPKVLLRYRLHPQQVVQKYDVVKLASAGRVRLAQLECLGIRPTEEEFALHQALGTWQFQATSGFIVATHAWLLKLKAANDVVGVYPGPAFLSVLGQRWYAVCAASTHLGLWTARTFWRSPLGAAANLTRKQLLKFVIKCGIRRRQHAQKDCDRIELIPAG